MATGKEILTRAATVLQDDDHVRWPVSELVGWINDAIKAIVLAKPSASSTSVVLSLIAGTLQSLTDASHLSLLRIPRNITTVGPPRVGGRAIRIASREALDTSEPSWHEPLVVLPTVQVRQYVYDEENPREFYVYPGNTGAGKVEAVVSVLPDALDETEGAEADDYAAIELGLPEPYSVPVLDYVLFRAYSKDAMGADAGRASAHFSAFATAVGLKVQAEGSNSPNSRARVATT